MSGHNDYDPIAHLYDSYVSVDFDIPFFCSCAAETSGAVLELMAGTGRVSVDLLNANPNLTCVDASVEMLKILKRKTASRTLVPRIVCADVRALPLECQFDLALIPFNSFSELTSADDQERTLEELSRVLVDGGRLVCTLHNPEVRIQTLDDKNRQLGTYELPGGSQFEFWVQGGLTSDTGLAYSRQTFRMLDETGTQVDKEIQEVRFSLIGKDEFEKLARRAGFGILSLVGDYKGTDFREDSPFLIWTLERLPRSDL